MTLTQCIFNQQSLKVLTNPLNTLLVYPVQLCRSLISCHVGQLLTLCESRVLNKVIHQGKFLTFKCFFSVKTAVLLLHCLQQRETLFIDVLT